MKNTRLTSILIGLTAFSAVASLILCGIVIKRAREIGTLQMQAAAVQQNRMAATQLLGELNEYSKRDPQIRPILQSLANPPATNSLTAK
jgi:hypothetical protein